MTYHGGQPLENYLQARIDRQADGCWLWTGNLLPSAGEGLGRYGLAIHRDLPKRKTVAHRAVYEHHVGPIPDGLQLDHLCRVRQCVNPAHLEPVTQQENIRRGAAIITHCPRGHEYDDQNTYVTPGGARQCRRCKCDREMARYRRLRAIADEIGLDA